MKMNHNFNSKKVKESIVCASCVTLLRGHIHPNYELSSLPYTNSINEPHPPSLKKDMLLYLSNLLSDHLDTLFIVQPIFDLEIN